MYIPVYSFHVYSSRIPTPYTEHDLYVVRVYGTGEVVHSLKNTSAGLYDRIFAISSNGRKKCARSVCDEVFTVSAITLSIFRHLIRIIIPFCRHFLTYIVHLSALCVRFRRRFDLFLLPAQGEGGGHFVRYFTARGVFERAHTYNVQLYGKSSYKVV